MSRLFRIALGAGLIAYGVYSGIEWFYLGIIPLFFGIINWCPLEKRLGGCDGTTGCCSSNSSECSKEDETPQTPCCDQPKGWSSEPKSQCCSK